MQRFFTRSAALVLIGLLAGCMARREVREEGPHVSLSFDQDWRFAKGDVKGAEGVGFEDGGWQRVDVPHDWSIAGPFDQKNPAGGAGAFLPGGVGWYRKHFSMPAPAGKRVFVTFDGVMANSDVWINGFLLGHRPYGYVTFSYELTEHLKAGENVLVVRADTSQQPASRWYAGSGIYRHVHLDEMGAVHLVRDGVFVTTPQLEPGATRATVRVRSEVVNQSGVAENVSVHVGLVDPEGKGAGAGDSAAQTIAPGATGVFEQDLEVSPEWWDLERPRMYRAETKVLTGGGATDRVSTTFGIRSAVFSATEGFVLNGKSVKLKGVCLHGDYGGLGVAVPLAAWEHRLAALKELGVNAIRTSHNPPAPEFLDLCDRIGFLVMDEMFDCWLAGKTKYDYHLYFKEWNQVDTRDTVRRDRNHPSVVLYSAGNEIHDTPNAASAIAILKGLVEVFHENDPTRPVTQALFRPNVSHDYTDGLADLLDVVGTNYRDDELLAAQRDKPSRKIVNTESGPTLKAWAAVRDHASYSGQFLWTGADYLGESLRWPVVHHESGLVDITDEPRGIGCQRQSWWSEKPMVAVVRDMGGVPTGSIPGEPQRRVVLPMDWTPENLSPHKEHVLVFSNCAEVELFLNGKSLGVKSAPADETPRGWDVEFVPGTLRAVGRNGGKDVAESELRTAGKAAKVLLTCDKRAVGSGFDDLAMVTARVVDDEGVQVPSARDRLTFSVEGPGVIVAVENADPAGHESYQGSAYAAYKGRCVAFVRGTAGKGGAFTVRAQAEGLEAGTVRLEGEKRETVKK